MNGNKAYKDQFIKRINNLIDANPSELYLRGFFNYLSKYSPSTIYSYMNYVLNFMKKIEKTPDKIALDDYTCYLASLINETSAYQIAVYSALKKFSIYLLASKKNLDNSMQYVERPKFKETQNTKNKREKGCLDTNEISKYLQSVEQGVGTKRAISRQKDWKERDMAIVNIFLSTGMRCSALYKLDINNIDFISKKLVVLDKGSKMQIYDLSNNSLDIIIQWLEKRMEILEGRSEEALFISNQKSRMTQSAIGRVVHKYAQVIPDKNITPHKLRATYGTQLYERTRDVYFVQECMGHSNPKTTELYIRGQEATTRKKASEIMSNIVK